VISTKRLNQVASIIMGQAPAGESYNTTGDGWPLIAGAGDFKDGKLAPVKYTSQASKLSEPGDIILSIRASIGDKVTADDVYCLGRGVAGIRAGKLLSSRYLWHWLTSVEGELANKGKGATFKQVNRNDIGELSIPMPPLDEQKRIAEVLDEADSLRVRRRTSIAFINDLTRSVFLEMFGDTASEFRTVTVGDLATPRRNSIRTGPFGSQLLHGEFVESGIPVLGIDNAVNNEFRWAKRRFITEEKYQKLSRYRVFPGDVIITIMGTCGRCAVVPEDVGLAINTKHLCCISLDRSKCLPEFLHSYFLMHPIARSYLEQTAKGAIMDGLNMNIIKAMPVALPPLDQQERYVAVAREVQEQRLRQLRHLEGLEELFGSLQARAFRGEL
jgi:type I restriction enzyme S subunit